MESNIGGKKMSNKPHSRVKKVSNTSINVKKKPVTSDNKKASVVSKIISTLIKK